MLRLIRFLIILTLIHIVYTTKDKINLIKPTEIQIKLNLKRWLNLYGSLNQPSRKVHLMKTITDKLNDIINVENSGLEPKNPVSIAFFRGNNSKLSRYATLGTTCIKKASLLNKIYSLSSFLVKTSEQDSGCTLNDLKKLRSIRRTLEGIATEKYIDSEIKSQSIYCQDAYVRILMQNINLLGTNQITRILELLEHLDKPEIEEFGRQGYNSDSTIVELFIESLKDYLCGLDDFEISTITKIHHPEAESLIEEIYRVEVALPTRKFCTINYSITKYLQEFIGHSHDHPETFDRGTIEKLIKLVNSSCVIANISFRSFSHNLTSKIIEHIKKRSKTFSS